MFFFLHVETVKGNGCSSGGSYSLRLPLKCEYDETSVNKSDGKAPSYKYVPVFSRCSLFSLSHHHNSFIGFVPCLAKWETKSAFQLLWFKISGTKTRHTSSHPTPSLSLSLCTSVNLCLSSSSTWSSWASHSTRCSITRPSWNQTLVAWTTSSKSINITQRSIKVVQK